MSKILWIGDGGCTTGFGRVTHSIGDRLVERGHSVDVLAINHRGDPFDTKVRLWMPTSRNRDDTYGFRRVVELLNEIRPDVVVLLNDPQIVHRYLFENGYDPMKMLLRHPIIWYVPIDGYNLPSLWQEDFLATTPIAMSKHGQDQIPNARLVYHGVDTEKYWPVSSQRPIRIGDFVARTKKECKEAVGLPPDAFVVGRVDRNSGRKDYAALWKALQPVMKRHSDVIAYFHCRGKDERSGTNLEALFTRDMDTMKQFRLPAPDQFDPVHGFPEEWLNILYNAFDVFASTSRGEGFGLTIAEALACGVPVIAQNVSSIPEVVGPGGELIDPQREITVPFGQDQWLADIGAFSEAIEHAYNSRGWRREKGKAGRDHVARTFQWDAAADKFHEYAEVLAHGNDSAGARGDGGADPDGVGAAGGGAAAS